MFGLGITWYNPLHSSHIVFSVFVEVDPGRRGFVCACVPDGARSERPMILSLSPANPADAVRSLCWRQLLMRSRGGERLPLWACLPWVFCVHVMRVPLSPGSC